MAEFLVSMDILKLKCLCACKLSDMSNVVLYVKHETWTPQITELYLQTLYIAVLDKLI